MALEIRQNLKLSQQLIITPQLQQSIKLLQLSRMELLEVVRDELLENPILEEEAEESRISQQEIQEGSETEIGEKKLDHANEEVLPNKEGDFKEPSDFDWDNYMNTYNAPEHISGGIEELPTYENTLTQKASLQDHLLWQLSLSMLSEAEQEFGAHIIGSINEDGYLQESLEEIAEKANVPIEKVEMGLQKIQSFDPPGVGARDLKECLLLQIRYFNHEKELLEKLVSNHLSELEKRDFKKISKEMKISIEHVVELSKLVHELEPKPGRPFSDSSAEYITPDVYVYKVGDDWVVVLNEDGLPKLQVSPFYRNMLQSSDKQKQENAKEYIQTKLRSAIWLIRSIHQRQRTLYKVVKAIVKFQKDFFEKGIDHLKPMILRDVAEEIGMHESTVSRVTTSKYVHTHRGIFELKYFFNNGVQGSEGDSIASETIKEKIRQLVANENLKSPYSDQEIVELLKEHKIEIARRTVAKYREMIGILPSSKRKQLY
ncbi:MAG: RNA polymerase factor sigma-54 [Deltaproteobacteria bacterium]|nr:RNA polymerase factor sigma-54 [Deltaproteobacteria bacterium]